MTTTDARRLALGIVEQAVKDWRVSVRRMKKYRNDPERYMRAKARRDECERFFRSDWCEMLTDINMPRALEVMRREEEQR